MRIDWKLIALALVMILGFAGRKQLETVFSNGRDLFFSGMSFKSGGEIFEPEPINIDLPDLEDNTETTEEATPSEEKAAEAEWQSGGTAQAKTTVSVVKTITLEEAEVKIKEIQKETEVLAKGVTKLQRTDLATNTEALTTKPRFFK